MSFAVEVNFDGLIGPSHNYGGLSDGNLASAKNAGDVSNPREAAVQALCLRAFAAVGAHGWGRVDVLFDEAGVAQLLEVNTVPGMTDHSLVPMAARARGIDFDTLVARILATSQRAQRAAC